MDDRQIHDDINALVAEEHRLRSGRQGLTDAEQARLRQLEEQLDRAWDLLRQREALRDAGRDPDEAQARPAGEVESYLQ